MKKLCVWSLCLITVLTMEHSHVVLFNKPEYKGIPERVLEYRNDDCKSFDIPVQVSSIKVHGNCVTLFTHVNCTGENITVTKDVPLIVYHTASVKYC